MGQGPGVVMDAQLLMNIGVGMLVAIGGWFAKSLWTAVSDLNTKIHTIEVELPSRYIRKDEFHDGMRSINEKLDKIVDKLDLKQDK